MVFQVTALIRAELLQLLRDRRGRLALLLPPLLQLLLFGYAASFDIADMPIVVVNEDYGDKGRDLVARFAASPAFHIVAFPGRESEAMAFLDRQDAAMIVHIGPRFSATLRDASGGDVQVITDGRRLNTALTLQSYASGIVAGFGRDNAVSDATVGPQVVTVTRAWYNPNLLSPWFAVPGLVGKLLVIANLTISALLIARDRESGLIDQLRIRSVGWPQLVCGKAAAPIAIGLVQGAALAFVGAEWFNVPFRGGAGLFAASLFGVLFATTGIGMLISAICASQQRATLGAFLFVVPAVLLSGFAVPISSMPPWLQALTLVNPMRYFIAIVRDLFLRGAGWEAVLPQLWPLLAIGCATFLLSILALRRAAA